MARRETPMRLSRPCLGLVVALLVVPLAPAMAQDRPVALEPPRPAQAPEPLCYCWNDGRKIAEGATSCIRTTAGRRVATCGRVINMMSWAVTEQACPES